MHLKKSLRRIILSASGGALRDLSKQDLENVQLIDSLKHPNWPMGAKFTIDSASMYNKAAEVEYIFVNPMFRRQGLAKKLLSIVEIKTKIKPTPQDPISPLGEKLFNLS